MNAELRTISSLAGPKGMPLLGNLLQINARKLHTIMESWVAEHGGMFQFKLANKTVVAIGDPTTIQTIFRLRPKVYRRISTIERAVDELSCKGVFASEGEQWQRQRQLAMQAFRPEQIKRLYPVMHLITRRLLNRWQASSKTGPIDIQDDWRRLAVDMTTNFAFGYDINLLEQESNSFQHHLDKLLPLLDRRSSAPFPYWRFIKPPSEKDMEKSLDAVKENIMEVASEARKRLSQASDKPSEPANFLEALLLARDDAGNGLSDSEIVGNVITILIAGEDTTASTLSWLVYLMARQPEVQRRIQQEVDMVLGEQRMPQTIADTDEMSYLEATALETLRLKSAVPISYVEPNEDVEIQGIMIPKGTFLMLVNRHGALQDENFFRASDFVPERWIGEHPSGQAHNRNAYVPFGAGPRFCPGRNLALLEIKMTIATLCRNFQVDLAEPELMAQEVFSFTMRPDKVHVILKPR